MGKKGKTDVVERGIKEKGGERNEGGKNESWR